MVFMPLLIRYVCMRQLISTDDVDAGGTDSSYIRNSMRGECQCNFPMRGACVHFNGQHVCVFGPKWKIPRYHCPSYHSCLLKQNIKMGGGGRLRVFGLWICLKACNFYCHSSISNMDMRQNAGHECHTRTLNGIRLMYFRFIPYCSVRSFEHFDGLFVLRYACCVAATCK